MNLNSGLFCLIAMLSVSLALTSCLGSTTRNETAMRIAAPAYMEKREIEAGPFILTVFEKVNHPGEAAQIYIEGDGLAWVSKHRPSLDPTPTNPIALRLASIDPASNVIYMARPCQYSKTSGKNNCSIADWTSSRFSREIINSMNTALSEITTRYGLKELNLIGFSGGATIAAFMAAERDDVASLRTVGGNLNHAIINSHHRVSQLSGSLNAIHVAAKLSNMPQHHFIGNKDKVIPLSSIRSFTDAAGETSCIRTTIVKGASHEDGWVSRWQELLNAPLDCNSDSAY